MNVNVNEAEDMSMVQVGNTSVETAVPSGALDEQDAAVAVTAAAQGE